LFEIIGHVDARDRPIVSLSLPDQQDGILVHIDTGFNRELLIRQADVSRVKCHVTNMAMPVEFASGEHRTLRVARGRIVWFGGFEREVDVLIVPDERLRPALPDEPIALLGTSLLASRKLTVDFWNRRVVISSEFAP
jgi:predicted aspartyl protease